MTAPLPPGTPAPDLVLPSTMKRPVGPPDFRGRPLILVFYPADWSPVCTDQLGLYQEIMPEFQRHGAELLGISVDSLWSHLAFARDRTLRFPLISSRKGRCREPTGCIGPRMERASERSSCSTLPGW